MPPGSPSPLFLLAGDGSHRFQPVHVRDIAELMEELGTSLKTSGEELDARVDLIRRRPSGKLFTKLRDACGGMARIAAAGPPLDGDHHGADKTDRLGHGRHLLDADDLDLLCSGLTVADVPDDPRIRERRSLFDWIEAQGRDLGRSYVCRWSRALQ